VSKAAQKGPAAARSAVSSASSSSARALGSAPIPCSRAISLGQLGDVVAEQLHVHNRVRQRHVWMVVGSLGGRGDRGDELETRDEVAGEEPRMEGLGELPPVVETGVEDLPAGELLHALSMSRITLT
jgi:hypothetical protein